MLALLTLFWGSNWPAMKFALIEIPLWQFRFFCLVVGTAGLMWIARAQGHRLSLPPGTAWPLFVCGLLNVVAWQVFSAISLIFIEAARASIIAYTMPLWSAIFAIPILGERLNSRQVAGLVLGMVGLLLLLPNDIAARTESRLGILAMLAAALAWAFGTIALKYYKIPLPTTSLTAWQLAISLPLIGLGALTEPLVDVGKLSATTWLAVAYTTTIPMIYCYWAWFRLVELLPATIAGLSTLAIPAVGVFSSAMILDEPLGPAEIGSLVFVVAAIALVLYGGKRPA
jgi:drug/metabolite transporter (DMT)-like permease